MQQPPVTESRSHRDAVEQAQSALAASRERVDALMAQCAERVERYRERALTLVGLHWELRRVNEEVDALAAIRTALPRAEWAPPELPAPPAARLPAAEALFELEAPLEAVNAVVRTWDEHLATVAERTTELDAHIAMVERALEDATGGVGRLRAELPRLQLAQDQHSLRRNPLLFVVLAAFLALSVLTTYVIFTHPGRVGHGQDWWGWKPKLRPVPH